MDNLRVCRINSISNIPVGLPITFDGKIVGKVIESNNEYCECTIDDDVYRSLIRTNNMSFSLEVRHK